MTYASPTRQHHYHSSYDLTYSTNMNKQRKDTIVSNIETLKLAMSRISHGKKERKQTLPI